MQRLKLKTGDGYSDCNCYQFDILHTDDNSRVAAGAQKDGSKTMQINLNHWKQKVPIYKENPRVLTDLIGPTKNAVRTPEEIFLLENLA